MKNPSYIRVGFGDGSCGPNASALDRLLDDGAIGEREHAAGLAYPRTCADHDRARRAMRSIRNGGGTMLPEAAWFDLKRRHAAPLRAASLDGFAADRLVLDGDAPLRCELERVRTVRGRG